MYEKIEYAIDTIIELGVATDAEIKLVFNINGYSMDTVESVIYARTGYKNIEHLELANQARTSDIIENALMELEELGYSSTDIWNETDIRPFGWSESMSDIEAYAVNPIINNTVNPYGYHTDGYIVSVEEFEEYITKFIEEIGDL